MKGLLKQNGKLAENSKNVELNLPNYIMKPDFKKEEDAKIYRKSLKDKKQQ